VSACLRQISTHICCFEIKIPPTTAPRTTKKHKGLQPRAGRMAIRRSEELMAVPLLWPRL
jgi:hypothetical protein